jgi:signal transduction histidine kinase
MRFRSWMRSLLSGNRLVLILCSMVVIHVAVMIAYTQYTKLAVEENSRDEIIEQMVYIIGVIQNAPSHQRPTELNKIKFPNITASLSQLPLWPLHIEDSAFWEIEPKLHQPEAKLYASYHLPSGEWLNLHGHIHTNELERQLFLIILEIVVASALLFSAWSMARFTQPLKRFKEAAERLGVDLQSESLIVYGPSIVQETAGAMNQMQKKIQELLNNRTKMLAAISHDLRTPITRLKLRSHFINNKEIAEKVVKDLDEMEAMITQILAYAKAEFQDENKIKLDLNSLLTTICSDMQDLGHDVTYIGVATRTPFWGRSIALNRAFSNLINNAVKYGKKVIVDLHKDETTITVTISDNGPGIPEEELVNVFAPFYRTDKARSSDTGGVGLGLAVTRDIVRAHGGKIILENRVEGGLSAIVKLPLKH